MLVLAWPAEACSKPAAAPRRAAECRQENNHTAANMILTPSKTNANTRQRIDLLIYLQIGLPADRCHNKLKNASRKLGGASSLPTSRVRNPANPEGILQQSPGLRAASYPGSIESRRTNPVGVACVASAATT